MTPEAEQLDASLLRIGQEFAGYRVEAGLGRQSGVGRVYEATHLESERQVALKVFAGQSLQDPVLRKRFTHTAEVQARLRHAAIARLEAWGTEPAPYLAMTFVRGPTLADLLEEGNLGDRRALDILRAVALGLDAAGRRGLVYRRLQPRGILVEEESGRAFLGDFGAARPARSTDLIETGRLGTFADYISPEEADDGETTSASVVYSLGAIVFESLTGRPPFFADQQWATLRGHLEAPPRGPHALRDDLPEALDGVIERALAKDPAERHSSPANLMRAVERAYPIAARSGAVPPAPSRRLSRRRVGGALVVAVAVAAAAGLGAVASGGKEAGPRKAERVANADLRLRYPADWEVSRRAPEIEGLTLARPVALSPPADSLDAGDFVAGRLASGTLPVPTKGQVVDLRGVLGRRYEGLREHDSSRPVVAYAVPAAGGEVVAACLGPTSGTFAARCRRVASTVRPLREGPPLVGASPDYARSLRRLVSRLGRVRAQGRRQLARARTPAGQRRLTARMTRSYARLAGVLARIDAPAPARPHHRVALGQLRRATRGLRDMSRAARARSQSRWISARRGVQSAEGRFQRALRALRRLGYDVR